MWVTRRSTWHPILPMRVGFRAQDSVSLNRFNATINLAHIAHTISTEYKSSKKAETETCNYKFNPSHWNLAEVRKSLELGHIVVQFWSIDSVAGRVGGRFSFSVVASANSTHKPLINAGSQPLQLRGVARARSRRHVKFLNPNSHPHLQLGSSLHIFWLDNVWL